MTARFLRKLLLACCALALLPATAPAVETSIQIKDFDVTRYAPASPVTDPPDPGGPEYSQAGGHPNTNIYMQFCGEGAEIADVTGLGTSPIRITTAEPHGQPLGTFVFKASRVIGVLGNLRANGGWFTRATSANEIELFGSAPSGDYTGGGEIFFPAGTVDPDGTGPLPPLATEYGCTPAQVQAFLKDFTLKLPPGFLGSPTAVPACPTHLWLAGSCPANTQLGHAVADTIPAGSLFIVTTSVFNLQTLGWEPARLGTEVVPGIPPGPLPNTVTLRTAPDPGELSEPNQQGADRYEGDEGDYGVNSYQINIPKELGGNPGKVRAIDIVLCAYVPCQEAINQVPQTVAPSSGDVRPFFVNPTSCPTTPAQVRLEARSYSVPDEVQFIDVTGLPTGGTFTLTFRGETTAPIPFNATDAEVQSALEALPSIGAGSVTVIGRPARPDTSSDGLYSVRFRGALGAANLPEMTASAAGLTPSGGVTIRTTNEGQGGGQDGSREEFAEVPLPVTGCDSVPFGVDLSVEPGDPDDLDNSKDPVGPGASGRQTISIDYPDYASDAIWQAQLKDADTNLPPGMGLAPGGGVGLRECSFGQFGVDPATNKQLDNEPVSCPEGSHVGDLEVETPVLPLPLGGKAFFGPTGSPGRPTASNPWKLFLLLEGQGVRVKLVGDVTLSPSGQVRTVFLNNPETPFTSFKLKMGTAERAVLLTPLGCGVHTGSAPLTGYNGATRTSSPSIQPQGCNGTPFEVNIDEASASPEQAGSHSRSHIVISRTDPSDMLSGLKLSLPPGAAGSLSGVPKCTLGNAQAGTCPESSLVGNIKTSLGSSASLFTVPGKLYLAEPAVPGDVASIVATVPAKAGVPDASGKYPIDLGPDVVIINRLLLREADTGVDVILDGAYRGGQRISDGIPTMLEGVPLPIRQIEITVDREGFFLNPTGCDPRTLMGIFTSASGQSTSSSMQLQATGCDKLPFDPALYMIVGERGKTNAGQDVHPPLTAIVTQKAGEAAISRARVLLPDIVRPNVPFLNEPGALCSDAQAQARTCPPKSLVGSARVITPILPFELSGPVHIVQEIGSILPKLYVYLRGGGFEVLLRARNRITGVRTENTFDFVPDVPQSYFELKIKGGEDGLLNNFFDLCDTPADSKSRQVDYTFNGHNGAVVTEKFPVRVEGCGSTIAAARVSRTRISVSRNGVAKVRVQCRRRDATCRGRLRLRAKRFSAAKTFRIPRRKTRTVRLKFSKREVRRLRRAKRLRGRATTTVGGFGASRRNVTIVPKRRGSASRITVRRNGVARARVKCRRKGEACRGSLVVRGRGVATAKTFRIPGRKTRTVSLRFSKGDVRQLRRARRMKGRATTTVGGRSLRRSVTIVYKRR
ncbi:MAG: hypothetical protein ACRDLQ_07760 [Solirubrobacterales bacterium]